MIDTLFGAHPLLGVLTLIYVAVLAISVLGALLRQPRLLRLGVWLLAAAFLLNTWVIVARWLEAGRPPFKTLFETLLLYPWCVALVALVLMYLHRLFVLVPFAAGISAAGLVHALRRPDLELVDLPPALQSGWFVPHVVTYFVAYAALFASAALALVAIVLPGLRAMRRRAAERRLLAAGEVGERRGSAGNGRFDPALETHAHRAALFGIATLSLGLVLGGVWGKYAWGDYWSWDPKENWALVTWLAYVLYLHVRLLDGWRGRPAMGVLILSFATVVFTYLGMHLLPTAESSLHVYQ